MANPSKPRTKLDVQPGEDIWTMARELSSHPDSPASLQIMSAVNSAMRPRNAAADQVVSALAEQLENPGPAADAAVTSVNPARPSGYCVRRSRPDYAEGKGNQVSGGQNAHPRELKATVQCQCANAH